MANTSTATKKVTLSWEELNKILSSKGIIIEDETIQCITLTKPRQILIHTSRNTDSK